MKVRVDHLLIGVGAVVVLVGGTLAWRATRPDPERAELDEKLETLRDKPGAAAKGRQTAPRFLRRAGNFSSKPEPGGEGQAIPQTPPEHDPGDLDPDQAVDEFKAVLAELEDAVDDGRELGELERAELYNRATGSFTALSAWVDGSDPGERAAMDDAYARMMSLMRALDLEPPSHDPDPAPVVR